MDFLRRLHPSAARAVGAAQLDLPWPALDAGLGADPPATKTLPGHGLLQPWPRAAPGAQVAPARAAAAAPAPLSPAEAPAPWPAHPPAAAPYRPAPADTAAPTGRADMPAHAPMATATAHAAPLVQQGALPDVASAAPMRPQVADHPRPAAALPTAVDAPLPVRPPLRDAVVRAATRASATHAGPIVQVTIDRIDVRLPPSAPAATSRRSRPASGVAPLADYLRGRTT